MAEPSPWQLARPAQTSVRRREVFARDLYNFTATSVSQGTNNPVVYLPCMGPHAAGAVPPTKFPSVESVEITVTGTIAQPYGVNSHQVV